MTRAVEYDNNEIDLRPDMISTKNCRTIFWTKTIRIYCYFFI